MKSIWERRGEIERARVKKNQELMGEYDRTVYYPAMLALQKECEEGILEGCTKNQHRMKNILEQTVNNENNSSSYSRY